MIGSIGEIMTENLVTIDPDSSVRKAVELMEQHKVGCLPVLDGQHLVGIITSRDVKRAHSNRLVADAMTKNVITTTPDCSLWDAKELLDNHNIERVIVIDKGVPVGIITKAQLYAELGKYLDGLTNLSQAVFLRIKALELLKKDQKICLIFFDIDNFGTINKESGHVIGDQILCQVANLLRQFLNETTDHLCRYAGDEFAIVTTRSMSEAQKLGSRIITKIKSTNWPDKLKINISVGIAGEQRNNSNKKDLLKVVNDLINNASLASTKAKKESSSLVVA
jgi:diguanylate cyclase (GGDEF)-like protein